MSPVTEGFPASLVPTHGAGGQGPANWAYGGEKKRPQVPTGAGMTLTLPPSPAGPHVGGGSSAVVPFMRIDLAECKHVKSSLSPL